MKRPRLVKAHLIATAIAVLTISTFFTSSLIAEILGQEPIIRTVKIGILYALPLLAVAMITLAVTGNKLAGNSRHPEVLRKQHRMKFITANGMMLVTLAVFLYYQATYQTINTVFLGAQLVELALGFTNLVLIGLNIKAGLKLAARKPKKSGQPTPVIL
ncbi:MAG: hypothetical protein ACFB15_26975 [Cyclobacteriaceae bacterium]